MVLFKASSGSGSSGSGSNDDTKLFNHYVLELIDNKYYVGKTTKTVEQRFCEHLKGPLGGLKGPSGAAWTKLYRPLKIIHQERGDTFLEEALTLKYMTKYGIPNVRGQVVLSKGQLKHLSIAIKSGSDLCFKCGQAGHFAKNCNTRDADWEMVPAAITATTSTATIAATTATTATTTATQSWQDFFVGLAKTVVTVLVSSSNKYRFQGSKNCCWRCGYTNHTSQKCFAKRDINGQRLDN